MRFIRFFLSFLLLLFIFDSCTVHKRVHRKGYYVEWKKNEKNVAHKQTKQETEKYNQSELVNVQQQETNEAYKAPTFLLENEEEFDLASSEKIIDVTHPTFEDKYFSDPCDKITMKNGMEINAKVFEVSDNNVRYKKCDNLDGPFYTMELSKIATIHYVNGTTDSFGHIESPQVQVNESLSTPTKATETNPKIEAFSILSFVFALAGILIILFLSILGGGLISLMAFIFGLVGQTRITHNPNKYVGIAFAFMGIVFSFIGIVMAIIFMVKIYQEMM